MKIKDIELFHGAVLTRLMRKDRPVAIKMFEFNANDYRSAYILTDNDKNDKPLYIKHSKQSQPKKRYGVKKSWQFTFSPEHIRELLQLNDEYGCVYIVLVCGSNTVGEDDTHIALLTFDKFKQCVDIDAKNSQVIHIGSKGGKHYLRVWGSKIPMKDSFSVGKSTLEDI